MKKYYTLLSIFIASLGIYGATLAQSTTTTTSTSTTVYEKVTTENRDELCKLPNGNLVPCTLTAQIEKDSTKPAPKVCTYEGKVFDCSYFDASGAAPLSFIIGYYLAFHTFIVAAVLLVLALGLIQIFRRKKE